MPERDRRYEEELRRLRSMLVEGEPRDVRSYLAQTFSSGPRFAGTSVPALGIQFPAAGPGAAVTASGLVLPASFGQSVPDGYVGTYVTVDDYSDVRTLPDGTQMLAERFVRATADGQDRVLLLRALAAFNHIAGNADKIGEAADWYSGRLSEVDGQRLRQALASREGATRFLARQVILACIRYLLVTPRSEVGDSELPLDFSAILLTHGMGLLLAAKPDDDGALLGRWPAYLVMEVVRLGLLYEADDMYMTIDRTIRLWREYGSRVTRTRLRKPPADLLAEATGLEVENILAFGFLFMSHVMAWNRERSYLLPPDLGSDAETSTKTAFLDLCATTLEELGNALEGRDSRFDFLPLQERPVLELGDGFLVLDEHYLWERVTKGLFWMVHDHERDTQGDAARRAWTQAYGEMVELMVEDELRPMALPLLGGGSNFFTEEDFARAYKGKKCDAGVDFGETMLLAEAVGGQLTIGSRLAGDIGAFRKDTEKLVIKKCRQLHHAALSVLNDRSKLTGSANDPRLRIVPVVVVGGGYPVNFMTVPFVRELLHDERLLEHARIEPLCIIDLAELEMLEGLAESGNTPVEVLSGWQQSPLEGAPLRNYLLETYGSWNDVYRPRRTEEIVRQVLDQVIPRVLPRGERRGRSAD